MFSNRILLLIPTIHPYILKKPKSYPTQFVVITKNQIQKDVIFWHNVSIRTTLVFRLSKAWSPAANKS